MNCVMKAHGMLWSRGVWSGMGRREKTALGMGAVGKTASGIGVVGKTAIYIILAILIAGANNIPHPPTIANHPGASAWHSGVTLSPLSFSGTRYLNESPVVITEIMYNPASYDTLYEWLEICNVGTQPIDIGGWQFYDSGSLKSLTLAQGSTILQPKAHAIIARNATAFLEYCPWYKGTIFNCTSMSLGNTENDTIGLYNGGSLQDIVVYNTGWGGGSNCSLELRDYRSDNNLSANWGETKVNGGTPGYKNTISPPVIIYLSYDSVVLDNTNAIVRARVDDPANVTSVKIYYRYNATSQFYNATMVDDGSNGDAIAWDGNYTYTFPPLAANTTVEFYVEAINVSGESNTYPWRAPYLLKSFEVVSSAYPSIVINEFLPSPKSDWNGDGANNSDDEYIELYNNDTVDVDLGGWQIDDIEGGSTPYTIPSGTIIHPGSVVVFFGSTTGVGLNNDGDDVRLLTPYGIVADAYTYTSSSDDVAYGRVPDGMAWTVLSMPSPGSLNQASTDLVINWVTRTPTQPSSQDSVRITANITHVNTLNTAVLNFSVNGGGEQTTPMSESGGKFSATIGPFNNGDSVEYHVFCRDNAGNIAESQTYSFTVKDYTTSVVINEFLPNPWSDWDGDGNASYRDEFIELYNPTGASADISGWYVDDEEGGSSPYQLPSGTVIGPYGFLVIYRLDSGLALNNDGDSVRLLDPRGGEYLNVTYTFQCGNDVSIGLYPDGAITAPYVNLSYPTPGSNNTPPIGSLPSISDVTVVPDYPLTGTIITVSAIITASSPILYARLNWDIDGYNGTETMQNNGNDTWSVSFTAPSIEGEMYYYIEAATGSGKGYYPVNATEGGRDVVHIYGSEPYSPYAHTLVINEIMANPNGDEAQGEWIEIYNNGTTAIGLINFTLTDQDGVGADYVFPDVSLGPGEYVVVHMGYGNDTHSGNVWHLYRNGNVSVLTNSGDDIVLYDSEGYGVDYVAYGSSSTIDPPPIGLSWRNTPTVLPKEGYTLALIPNGDDTDDGLLWRPSYPTPGDVNVPLPDEGAEIVFSGIEPCFPKPYDTITISADITDDYGIIGTELHYRTYDYNEGPQGDTYMGVNLTYNGTAYTVTIPTGANNTVLEFYITATDTAMNVTRYPEDGALKALITDYIPPVCVNEVLPSPSSDWNHDGVTNSKDEFIEIYNPSSAPVDLGWWMIDDTLVGGSGPYTIPFGTLLGPKGFFTVFRSESGVSLNNNGDNATLIDRCGTVRDVMAYTSASEDTSIGLYPDGNKVAVYDLPYPTPGSSNAPPPTSTPPTSSQRKLLITKIYYRDNGDYDFVAIYNPNPSAENISYWRLDDGEGYIVIPSPTEIGPQQEIYVAVNSTGFMERMHFLPNIALHAYEKGVSKASGNGINLANNGDNIALLASNGEYIDVVAFGNVNYTGVGWIGGAVKGAKSGEILTRIRLDPTTFQDTNSSADWEGPRHYMIGQSDFMPITVEGEGTLVAFVSPDCSFDMVKRGIEEAHSTIYLNLYQLTNWEIAKHIIGALNRGVKVYMYLAGTQVGGMEDEERYCLSEIHKAGGKIRFMASNETTGRSARYTYDHAKYCVIDNTTTIITTENWKYSGIPPNSTYGNRGWGIRIESREIAEYFATVFFADFDNSWGDSIDFGTGEFGPPPEDYIFVPTIPHGHYEERFSPLTKATHFTAETVLGPDNTLIPHSGILGMIERAEHTIYVEQLTVNVEWGLGVKFKFDWTYKDGYYIRWEDGKEHYNLYLKAIIDAARRGVKVRILMDSLYSKPYLKTDSSDMDNFDTSYYINKIAELEGLDMEARLIDLSRLGVEKLHAKGMVVDNESVLVGSINFGAYAAMYNRECGIIVTQSDVGNYFAAVFAYDFGLGNTTPTNIEPSAIPGSGNGSSLPFESLKEPALPELGPGVIIAGAAVVSALWLIVVLGLIYHAVMRKRHTEKV